MTTPALPASVKDVVQQLLAQALGTSAHMTTCNIVNHHPDYWVLVAELQPPHPQIVVKLAGPDAPLASDFDRTAYIHRLVSAHTNIPMPEILAVDTSPQHVHWRYLLKTFIPGDEWRTVRHQLGASQQHDAYTQIGNTVAQIHQIHFPAFGELHGENQPPETIDYLAALRERAIHSIRLPRLQALFLSVLDQYAQHFTGVNQAALCHEDLHHQNILFRREGDTWRLATILDFEKAWAGHAEIDLARLEFWQGMVGEGFWEAYNAHHQSSEGYAQRRPIYQLLWCLEYAAPTEKHLRDTQQLCERLSIPAPATFDA